MILHKMSPRTVFITVSYKDIPVFIQPATLYLAFVCLFHIDFLPLKDSNLSNSSSLGPMEKNSLFFL